ncbi:DDE superfamily endonuclease [Micromonospora echinofusca]|uniref:DDE superfamily endonuclease n=1 Tax=Micromonospora echinofusca TaxID=47858 RepID=A0A1C5GI38_MICEH|nr:DDE superfamily endonuclease [Micromonospora echinofusca]
MAPISTGTAKHTHRVIDTLAPLLALAPVRKRPVEQIAIDASTRLVIAVGDPQPGTRNDTIVYRTSGIAEKLDGRPVMADGGYRGNPEVIMPYRKPADGTDLPAWKEALNVEHRTVRAGVEHALARMKCFKSLRD